MHLEQAKLCLIEIWESSRLITDKRVLDAFRRVPRERFVLKEFRDDAYDDVPLPILEDQTISQPTTVMLMLQALEVHPGMKVLEIGAGSGYNAALLSLLAGPEGKVYTTEIIPELAKFAKANLKACKNVAVLEHDGSLGYSKAAPYDRIICTAGAPEVPKTWISQLADDGILLCPVGPIDNQRLIRYRKIKGKFLSESLGDFRFVPLTGEFGIKKRK
jgi:protein-L-isoaspartate(D-aspartate) O-methyltransferase